MAQTSGSFEGFTVTFLFQSISVMTLFTHAFMNTNYKEKRIRRKACTITKARLWNKFQFAMGVITNPPPSFPHPSPYPHPNP